MFHFVTSAFDGPRKIERRLLHVVLVPLSSADAPVHISGMGGRDKIGCSRREDVLHDGLCFLEREMLDNISHMNEVKRLRLPCSHIDESRKRARGEIPQNEALVGVGKKTLRDRLDHERRDVGADVHRKGIDLRCECGIGSIGKQRLSN
jgi:hypothetical protein